MKPHDVLSDIDGILSLLSSDSLAILVNPVVNEHRGANQFVTFRSHLGYDFEIQRDFTTIAEYRRIAESGCYSAMLNDGSLMQASYSFRRSRLYKHRLAFYPCPFAFDRDDLIEFGVAELIELTAAAKGFGDVFLRSPVRFDYSEEDARIGHPASHLTLNWARCRFTVTSPLSFGHFARLIFRNFYPHLWSAHEWMREIGVRRLDRKILPEEEEEAHIDLGLGRDARLVGGSFGGN